MARETTANAGLFKLRRATYGSLERANKMNNIQNDDIEVEAQQVC